MCRRLIVLFLLVVISGMAILLWGCPPRVIHVRPPEPRVEVYGDPPYPDAVWRPGHWEHRRGDWVWVPGHWQKRPKPHAVWVPGHWEPRGRGWVWVPGHWDYR
jgi:hypothetical protein